MPHEEELHLFSDERLLLKMSASVKDARYIVHRTEELIERSRIMLRELDSHGVYGRRIPEIARYSRIDHSSTLKLKPGSQ